MRERSALRTPKLVGVDSADSDAFGVTGSTSLSLRQRSPRNEMSQRTTFWYGVAAALPPRSVLHLTRIISLLHSTVTVARVFFSRQQNSVNWTNGCLPIPYRCFRFRHHHARQAVVVSEALDSCGTSGVLRDNNAISWTVNRYCSVVRLCKAGCGWMSHRKLTLLGIPPFE